MEYFLAFFGFFFISLIAIILSRILHNVGGRLVFLPALILFLITVFLFLYPLTLDEYREELGSFLLMATTFLLSFILTFAFSFFMYGKKNS